MKQIIFIIFLVATFQGIAQEKTTMDFLTNTNWHRVVDPKLGIDSTILNVEKYTETIKLPDIRDTSSVAGPFYLSDKPTEKFDWEKIGKAKEGEYIIVFNMYSLVYENINDAWPFEIKTINEKELVLYNDVFQTIEYQAKSDTLPFDFKKYPKLNYEKFYEEVIKKKKE